MTVSGLPIRAQPERGRPFGGSSRSLGGGQLAARAGIGAVGQLAVRRDGGVSDLAARAEAGIDETPIDELADDLVVSREAVALANDGSVPVDPETGEVGELTLLDLPGRVDAVEVLHPDQEARPCRSRRQPRDESGAQVAEVEVARRGGGEAAGHRTSLLACRAPPAAST